MKAHGLAWCMVFALALAIGPRPGLAQSPGVDVRVIGGDLRVTLQGSYAGAWFQVARSTAAAGPFAALASQPTLCTGDCFVVDAQADPGRTYWYRFDLTDPAGGLQSFGPFPVSVPRIPLAVRAFPNPFRDEVRLELSVPGPSSSGTTVTARARVLDLQGRVVRELATGPLSRGATAIAWDGRDAHGRAVGAGLYVVELVTPNGRASTRVARVR